jgi:hypothetical protein
LKLSLKIRLSERKFGGTTKRSLFIFDKERIDICRTALDGEERKLASDIRVRRGDTIEG